VFQRDGVVVEMARLVTPEERRRYLREAAVSFSVPDDRMPLMLRAIADERRSLGLEQ
jgi:hypothetical protein